MLKRATQNIRENLGVLVRVCPETFAAIHKVIVDHDQVAKSLMLGIVVLTKAKAVG